MQQQQFHTLKPGIQSMSHCPLGKSTTTPFTQNIHGVGELAIEKRNLHLSSSITHCCGNLACLTVQGNEEHSETQMAYIEIVYKA